MNTALMLVNKVLTIQPDNEEGLLLKARLLYYDQKFYQSENILSNLSRNQTTDELLKQVKKARNMS